RAGAGAGLLPRPPQDAAGALQAPRGRLPRAGLAVGGKPGPHRTYRTYKTYRSYRSYGTLPPATRCLMSDPHPVPTALEAMRARTPARILTGRAGPSYVTATQLALRRDHAAALDAVHAELEAERDLGRDFVARWRLFEVRTQARDKSEYLMRPDLGRRLDPAA